MTESKYWMGNVPIEDDFGEPIVSEFIDGRAKQGFWAFFTPKSWSIYGDGTLRSGVGQRYVKEDIGWRKVEG